MSLTKQPFINYKLEEEKGKEKREVFTVSINEDERLTLDKCKEILEQEKDSTTLKQLAWLGAKVLHDPQMTYVLQTVFDNKRRNKRMGVIQFDA